MIPPHDEKVPSYLFAGDELPPTQARDLLRERFSANFDLVLPPAGPIRVDGAKHLGLMFGGMAILWRQMYVHGITRGAALIRSSQIDHYVLTVSLEQKGPTLHVFDDGRVLEQRAGEPVVLDMARPIHLDIQSGTDLTLFIPRDALDELLLRRLDLHGVKLQGAVAALLVEHLRKVVREGPGLHPTEGQLLSRGMLHLLAACLAPMSDSMALARPQTEQLLMRRIGQYVESRLADPDLSVDQICTAFGLSRSSLYRLLEPMGGVAAFIRERRLSKAHQLLAGAHERVHLKRVADKCGFRSATQFSRAFHDQFGYTPSESRGWIAPLSDSSGPLQSEARCFATWLYSLSR